MHTNTVETRHSGDSPPNYETVWAILQETARIQKESAAEADRQRKETDRRFKRIEKNLGGLGDSMGQLIETLIAARLWEKFAAYPYNLKRAYQRVYVYDEKSWAVTEIDILLADTEWVMAVEVKREASTTKDVDRHIKRMELIRKYPPAEAKDKKLLGAIAGGVIRPDVRDYAHQSGFFVLELKGESVALVSPPEGFTPREW
jgi:hypothetical protein